MRGLPGTLLTKMGLLATFLFSLLNHIFRSPSEGERNKFAMRISNKLTIAVTALATVAVFTFSACHKQKTEDTEDTGYASDHATLEKTFSDAQSISDKRRALMAPFPRTKWRGLAGLRC